MYSKHLTEWHPSRLPISIKLEGTTSSGLQTLIDKADSYLKSHGLTFNSQKTECMINGLNPFNVVPNWTIDKVTLYLGDILNGNQHIESRKQAAQKAFYSLHAAGLKYEGVSHTQQAKYIQVNLLKQGLQA